MSTATEIRAENGWPCLCRGAMQNGGSFCARKRERDAARDGWDAEIARCIEEHDRAEQAEAALDRVTQELDGFTGRLGFGDNRTEPAATLAEMIDPIEQAFSEASEWRESPRICESCGEWLATQVCESCCGSGCGPGTASGAYEECEWCAGVGKVHPGCAEKSYADLVTEAAEWKRALDVERAKVAAGLTLADEWGEHNSDQHRGHATRLRAALDPGATTGEGAKVPDARSKAPVSDAGVDAAPENANGVTRPSAARNGEEADDA